MSKDGTVLFTTNAFSQLTHGNLTFDGITSTYYYIQIAQVAVKEIVDEFEVTVYHGNTVLGTKSYSVRTYCLNQLRDSDDEKDIALCEAVLHYGAYAQKYFHYKEDDYADKDIQAASLSAVPNTCNIDPSVDPTFGPIEAVYKSISLESKTYLNVYLVPASGYSLSDFNIAVTKNGSAYGSVVIEEIDGGWIYIRIYNIAAKEIADEFAITVTLKSDSSSATWCRSAADYMYDYQNDSDMADLMKSGYQYYLCAKASLAN